MISLLSFLGASQGGLPLAGRRAQLLLSGLILVGVSGCVTGAKEPQESAELSSKHPQPPALHWTEFGPNGVISVRTFATEPSCPEIYIEGVKQTMSSRAEPTPEFPIRVCEKQLPAATKDVMLRQEKVSLPPKNLKKIVILGDTGCRLKNTPKGLVFQACNDPKAWPFAAIAKAATAENPDLLIHVGDYHYREASCPEGEARCHGSPVGDTWSAWWADFFAPVTPLLSKAPWVFVRGNHELCSRAGHGYSLFLDPNPAATSCSDQTPPYTFTIGNHLFAVTDSADDKNAQESLNQIMPQKGKHLWVLTHRPFLTPPSFRDSQEAKVELPSQLRGKGKISAVFTGHWHLMSLNQFRDHRPPELILGNSGTELDRPSETEKANLQRNKNYQAKTFFDFGYLTLENTSDNRWVLTEHDANGKPVIRCEFKESFGHQTILNCDGHGSRKL